MDGQEDYQLAFRGSGVTLLRVSWECLILEQLPGGEERYWELFNGLSQH